MRTIGVLHASKSGREKQFLMWMSSTDSLHFARNGVAAAVLNNKIYVAGGSGGGMGGPPQGQPGNTKSNKLSPPSNMPGNAQQNHPVDLEVFILK